MVKTVNALSEEEVEKESQIHDLFMAAENVQGNLLEEYIANKIRPFGWLWCYGETLRAVDFCTKDGHYLLQIKNKNNTENSSSSAIREGTAVHKWYRLGSKRINGVYEPDFKWEALNAIINDNKTENCDKMCNLTEDDYHSFLKDVLTKNPRIIKE